MKKITFRVSEELHADFRTACRRRCMTQDVGGRHAMQDFVNPPMPKVIVEECPERGPVALVIGLAAVAGFLLGWLCL